MSDNEMTGGEAIARMIQAFDGGPMFGMGGFQLLPFYDAARHLVGLAEPEDVARAALFLASDESARTTGHVLAVDSGLTIS